MKKISVLIAALALCAAPAWAEPVKVVASTATFADLVKKVGGERVQVKAVAPPKFNVHFIQPRPSDVKSVREADLYVFSGLDLEAWSDALLEAAGRVELFRGGPRNVDLSHGIRLLDAPEGAVSRSEGDMHLFGNPHYQMNPENADTMAGTIAAKLSEIDPEGAPEYAKNLADFRARLSEKSAEWKAACAACAGREIVSYHKDIAYFADYLGLRSERFIEPKPGIPPTPRHLASLEAYMKDAGVRAIVQPVYYARGTSGALAARTGAKVVVIAQNVGEVEGTEDFFAFFDYNVRTMSEALK